MKCYRIIVSSIIALFAVSILSAQPWKLDSDISFSLTQNAYSDNWTGTELSSITWVANSTSSAEKQIKPWLNNKSTLKLSFGQTHLQKKNALGERYWAHPEKSTDKIDLESLVKFTLQKFVDPFVAVRFESQFIDQSDPALTRPVNPMLFTETAGVMRTMVDTPTNTLTARLGAAFREKIDREVLDAVTNDRETITTIDGGAEFVSEYKHIFTALDANFRSKLWVYQALFNSKSDTLPTDDWKAADMVWENVFTAKLWKMLNATLTVELRYDKELVDEVQWKQILGLGFSYSLF